MTDDPLDRHCEFLRPDGTRCQGYKITASRYCWTHEPTNKELVKLAQSKGGKRPWSFDMGDWEDMDIKTLEDCRVFLSRAINDLRAGRIPPQMLTSIASAIQALAKVLDMGELTARIEKIEAHLEKRSR